MAFTIWVYESFAFCYGCLSSAEVLPSWRLNAGSPHSLGSRRDCASEPLTFWCAHPRLFFNRCLRRKLNLPIFLQHETTPAHRSPPQHRSTLATTFEHLTHQSKEKPHPPPQPPPTPDRPPAATALARPPCPRLTTSATRPRS